MSTTKGGVPVDKLDIVAKRRENLAKKSKAGRANAKKQQPTPKQRRVAKLLIENEKAEKPKTTGQILIEAGYSQTTAATKQSLIASSPGVQKALAEWGFTPERVSRVLTEALDAKQGAWFKGEYHTSDEADHKVRLAATSTLGDFAGIKKYQVEQRSVNVNIDGKDLADMLGL